MRWRFREASKAAKPPIDPPIEYIGSIRDDVASIMHDEISLEAAAEFVGNTPDVLRKHYYRDKLTMTKLQEMVKRATVLQKRQQQPGRTRLRVVGGGVA